MSFTFTTAQIAFFATRDFERISNEIAQEIVKYGDSLRLQTALRSRHPEIEPPLLQACIEQVSLRKRIAEKTGMTAGTTGTRELLEQASSSVAARLHARLLAGERHVLECCAGMGADTTALARTCQHVTAVEANPVHAAILRNNMTHLGHDNVTVVESFAEKVLNSGDYSAIFADPSRRAHGKRTIQPDEYAPPLTFFFELRNPIPILIKAAPATKIDVPCAKIFVGSQGECKEQLLFLHAPSSLPLVIDSDTNTEWSPAGAPKPEIQEWDYIIEPHNAVIASGAVREYLYDIGCIPIDDAIAYGVCSEMPSPSALHTTFRILSKIPFSMKALQKEVRARKFNRSTEIKKRGFPMRPEEVYRKLTFDMDGIRGTIFLTRIGNDHYAFLAQRI